MGFGGEGTSCKRERWSYIVVVVPKVRCRSLQNAPHLPTTRPQKCSQTDTSPQQVGVHRDCFGCGRTCEACKVKYIRTCRFCRAEYCVIDNEGSSETEVRIDVTLPCKRVADIACSAIGVTRVVGGRENNSETWKDLVLGMSILHHWMTAKHNIM